MTISGTTQFPTARHRGSARRRWLLGLLCAASACSAQVLQPLGVLPNGTRIHIPGNPAFARGARPQTPPPAPAAPAPKPAAATPAPAAPVPSTPLLPPSLSDQPAQPAQVHLADGSLTVQANNSDLAQILHQIAEATGMSIDGLGKDSRVFGIYGPGAPRDVLSDLLTDSGYNFMMVGDTTSGAPRQLLLTAQDGSVLPPQPPNSRRPAPAAEDDTPPPPTFVMNQPDPNAPLPGAATNPAPPIQPQNAQGGIKTPQQILQELEQLHQQQQQQNNPQ
jgi:hypothetical protein